MSGPSSPSDEKIIEEIAYHITRLESRIDALQDIVEAMWVAGFFIVCWGLVPTWIIMGIPEAWRFWPLCLWLAGSTMAAIAIEFWLFVPLRRLKKEFPATH